MRLEGKLIFIWKMRIITNVTQSAFCCDNKMVCYEWALNEIKVYKVCDVSGIWNFPLRFVGEINLTKVSFND